VMLLCCSASCLLKYVLCLMLSLCCSYCCEFVWLSHKEECEFQGVLVPAEASMS
jgi:hypothetical protein